MATIVAASGGGSWSSTATWTGGVVPTASDDVQLSSGSGSVTITGTAALCRSLDCTGYVGTLAWNNALTVGTSTAGPSNLALKFVSGMTITVSGGSLGFVGTFGTTAQTIDLGGKTLGVATVFSGSGGSWQCVSAYGSTGAITHTAGTLDFNGQTVTLNSFTTSGSTIRTVTMGAASVTVSALSGWTASGSNLTINAGTSTITTSNTSAVFAGGGFTYFNVTFSAAFISPSITGVNTFNNVTGTSSAAKTDSFTFNASQTINGTLTLNGNSAINRLLVSSATLGTAVTLTCAAVSMTNVDLQDIAGAGAASWDLHAVTGNAGDCGGNSGITFTAATTQTATGTASFSWSTHGWTTHVPLPQDTVSIPNAFIATRVITVDMPRLGKDITCTCTGNPTLTVSTNTSIYGNLTLASGMLASGASNLTLSGRGSQTTTSNGVLTTYPFIINSAGGTYQLQDNWSTSSNFSLLSGTLDLNGETLSVTGTGTHTGGTLLMSNGIFNITGIFTTSGTTTRSIDFTAGGTINLNGTATNTYWVGSGSGFSTTGDSGVICFANTSTVVRAFNGGGFSYPILRYTVAGSTGEMDIQGSNSFAGLEFSDASNARTMKFTNPTTTTIRNASGWKVFGTSGKLITVGVGPSSTATLSCSSGTINSDYLSLSNVISTGGAAFYAGAHSTNGGSNTGWKFAITAASGGGNWSSTATWTGGVVPTSADDVLIASTSGAITIDAAAACRSLDCTGYTGTLTHNTSITLSIGTSSVPLDGVGIKLVSGMTYTESGSSCLLSFVSTSSTVATVDLGGKTAGAVTFNGSGGAWQIASSFTVTGNVTFSAGALDINGQTCTWSSSFLSTSGTRTLTLGAASISVVTAWNLVATGFTFNAGTSSITMTSNGGIFTGGSQTYFNVSFTAASGNGQSLLGANTFNNLTFTGPADERHVIQVGGSQTINATLTMNGNSTLNRLLVRTNSTGTNYTLTAATVTASNLDLMDITGAGAGSWDLHAITGKSGDCQGNSGITFTSSATQTWSGTSSGNWSTNAWTSRVPLPQDDVVISGAFSSATITVDVPRIGRNITFTGTTGTLTWTSSTYTLNVFGSITLTSAVTPAGSAGIFMAGRGSQTLTSAGKSYSTNLEFDCFGGTYTLQDDLVTTDLISLASGGLVMNGHNVTSTTFDGSSTNTRALTMGSGTWNLSSTAATSLWNMAATGLTLSAASSVIAIANASTNTRTFTGGGQSYGALTYTVAASTGQLSILDANTFDTINFSDASNARTLQLPASATTTIVTGFNVQGTSGKLMSVVSSSSGTAATLSKTSGIVGCDYLSLKDSTVTGGAGWYAGTHSTNVSGNTGWNFSASPSIFTHTQGALARIATKPTKAQSALGRIAINKTKTQGAISRIATKPTKTQPAKARIAKVVSKAQTATARVIQAQIKTQGAISRIALNKTKQQTAISRIATKQTHAQSALSRVANKLTKTQGAISRIALNKTKTQGATAHVIGSGLKHQTSVARIAQHLSHSQSATARITGGTSAVQSAKARIAQTKSITHAAISRIAVNRTNQQSARARIVGVIHAVQTATARLVQASQLHQTATAYVIRGAGHTAHQTATARISGSRRLATQGATACISNVSTDTSCDIEAEVTQANWIDVKVSAG